MYEHSNKNLEKARTLRKNMTPEERHLWHDYLKDYPTKFRKQYPVDRYILDFYCSQAKLGIELDGGGHYEPEQMEYDKRRTEYLNSKGIDICRYTNLDVKRNFEGVCIDIDRNVRMRL